MRDLVTDVLDVLGLLCLAAGLGFAAGLLVGWAGLVVTGLVILAGSWAIDRLGHHAEPEADERTIS